ncbi:carboxymuconolactone decarboxylase family protein [Oceanimonas doudoroffii]|uniref:Alkylhydroperoxidase n=1 Tax=Oceanimonas doudoroffii TaxID=84158 RepID=A0A233RH87_9GAMM|nr:carboxymuconolactone decarboxylase family protein [Oceanimonas doudoroffii]OXY82744.1 alkylhydroperoxidase [Oceanimonas doudoroffii]
MSRRYHMQWLALLDPEKAGDKARPPLEQARQKLGFVPNMYRAMANGPALLNTYLHGYQQFREHGSLNPVEQEVVLLVISRENGCDYCLAAHSTLADTASGVPEAVTNAIRARQPVPDARLAALAAFTEVMFSSRGNPTPDQARAFLDAGFDEAAMLDVILALAVKTLSNYCNHLFDTPVDDAFAGRKV